MRIAFLHPDLGLGGAERLIVDAAAGLSSRGHEITIFTSHFDPSRCFSETLTDAFHVHVAGSFLPRAVFGRLHVLFAVLRMLWLSLAVACGLGGGNTAWDVLIVDQVSACVPLLRLFTPNARILFYAHFPDLLLAPRGNLLRKVYRAPFDALEEISTGLAHGILVNSNFTSNTFRSTFNLLTAGGVLPSVLYPCVECGEVAVPVVPIAKARRRKSVTPSSTTSFSAGPLPILLPPLSQITPRRILLSINRYERKKDLAMLLRAFAATSPLPDWHLILAGGYDSRLEENVSHFNELSSLAIELNLVGPKGWSIGTEKMHTILEAEWPLTNKSAAPPPPPLIGSRITLLRSVSDAQKTLLLQAAAAVAYTPRNEHFGIVPLECMAAWRPIIASSTGGPLESVVDGSTGILSDGLQGWRDALECMMKKTDIERARMGAAGAKHVAEKFSRKTFAVALEGFSYSLLDTTKTTSQFRFHPRAVWLDGVLWMSLLGLLFLGPVSLFYLYNILSSK